MSLLLAHVSGPLIDRCPGTLLCDHFDGYDGTLLSNHYLNNPAGTKWTIGAGVGTVQLSAGTAIQSGTAVGSTKLIADSGQSDVTVQCSMVMPSGNYLAGLLVRWQDANNFWLAEVTGDGANNVGLAKVIAGVTTNVVFVSFTVGAGTHTIKVITSGTSIGIYVDGVLKASTIDVALQAATICGFLTYNDGATYPGTITHDDFQVTFP